MDCARHGAAHASLADLLDAQFAGLPIVAARAVVCAAIGAQQCNACLAWTVVASATRTVVDGLWDDQVRAMLDALGETHAFGALGYLVTMPAGRFAGLSDAVREWHRFAAAGGPTVGATQTDLDGTSIAGLLDAAWPRHVPAIGTVPSARVLVALRRLAGWPGTVVTAWAVGPAGTGLYRYEEQAGVWTLRA